MQSAFATAIAELDWQIDMAPPSECGLRNLESALEKFNHSTPLVKKQLLRMLGLAVMQDHVVESREAELLRATADAIGCSVPPFVETC